MHVHVKTFDLIFSIPSYCAMFQLQIFDKLITPTVQVLSFILRINSLARSIAENHYMELKIL